MFHSNGLFPPNKTKQNAKIVRNLVSDLDAVLVAVRLLAGVASLRWPQLEIL